MIDLCGMDDVVDISRQIRSPAHPSHDDIAIIGMSCLFPGAPDVQTYWQNIVSKVDAISDPPEDWEAELFYDPASQENDRIYCKRGGYLGELARFDPLKYGVMPNSIDGGEPDQFLALRVAHEALADAGYLERAINRERVEVILGRGTYINRGFTTVVQHGLAIDRTLHVLKQLHPEHTGEELQAIKRELKASLPPFNAEMAPALVPNLVTGRIANRLDFMGPNYTVDAACASSHLAVDRGIQDLRSRRCDLAVVGGVHASTPAPILMIFCQLNALSRTGRIRPFDKEADGTLLGEGIGIMVLKRREEAERDGDHIYALIKGIGTASDGRALGLLAPRVEGEELALRRAYEATGISPRTVELIEAHGTGTAVGDLAEIQALTRVFGPRDGAPWCAVGSVKSMISHLIPASGIAGLIKAALALYHKVLPPTLNCEEPNPRLELDKTPFYINTETRPWIHGAATPRRAGMNAFGFGGINAHALLEEYTGPNAEAISYHRRWETEVCILQGDSRQDLIRQCKELSDYLSTAPQVELKDLAYTLNSELRESAYRLAIVASSLEDLEKKLTHAFERLQNPQCGRIKDQSGIFFFEEPLSRQGKLAFMFPGEGSQYINMLSDLCVHFPEVRAWFDLIDRVFIGHHRSYLPSQVIFPTWTQGPSQERDEKRLWQMDCGPESIFAANQAMFALLSQLQIQPQAIVGHSTGEYSALVASGTNPIGDEERLIQGILHLNALYEQLLAKGQIPEGVLLTVGGADRASVLAFIEQSEDLYLAMDNCPNQMVLCGTEQSTAKASEELGKKGAICTPLPFNRAYHTPMFEPFCKELGAFFQQLTIVPPEIALYSCTTTQSYPQDPAEIRRLAVEQWARPVRFRETIEAMYDAGVRIFVEVGPRHNLAAFIDDIFRGRPYLAVASDVPHRSGITQLNHLVALLAAQGVSMRLTHLYARRTPQRLSLEKGGEDTARSRKSSRSIRLATGLQPLRLKQSRSNARSHGAARSKVTSAPHEVPDGNGACKVAALNTPLNTPRRASRPEAISTSQTPRLSTSTETIPQSKPQQAPFRSQAMQGYLNTMEQFLNLQQEVMHAFIKGARNIRPGTTSQQAISAKMPSFRNNPERSKAAMADLYRVAQAGSEVCPSKHNTTAAAPPHRVTTFPFIGTISSLVPGQELVALRQLDLDEDLFLKDHTLGRFVSMADDQLLGLPVVPLTISMEMLAEAGAALVPGKVLIGMREIRAHRWIALDEGRLTLQVIARKTSASRQEVEVQIKEAAKPSTSEAYPSTPIIEGTVVFGDRYPDPPPVGEFPLHSERPSKWTPERLYTEVMFHGPSFQGVASVDRWGEDGIEGTLKGLPIDRFFRSIPNPHFLTDAVPLDATGQLVGYWTAEHLERAFHVFPFRVEGLHIYGPNLRLGEFTKCRARIALIGESQVRSDIDMIGPNRRLCTRIMGWWDRRFDLPDRLYELRLSPRDAVLSTPWPTPVALFLSPEAFRCCRLDGLSPDFLEAHGKIWQRGLAHLVLSRREREAWRNLKGPERRRTEWLLGRAAAKDTIRLFLKDHYGIKLCPADIEIAQDEHGHPLAQGSWTEELQRVPLVSIAHSDGIAVAIAGDGGRCCGVGIDIERIGRRREGLKSAAFSPEERGLLTSVGESSMEEWTLRLWCAKEAVAKAIGLGLMGGPLGLQILDLDVHTGLVQVILLEESARELSNLATRPIAAYTAREGELVFASSLI
jgi:acyl transferase domain-containing protein/phosphopantetheinyl transferase